MVSRLVTTGCILQDVLHRMYILQSTARYETLHVWFPTARYKAVTTGEGKSSGPHSHSTLVFSSSVRRVSLHLPMQMHLLLSSGMIIGRSSYFRMVFCSFHFYLSSCWRRSCRERTFHMRRRRVAGPSQVLPIVLSTCDLYGHSHCFPVASMRPPPETEIV